MSIEDIKTQMEQKMSMAAGLSAKILFDFGDDGQIYIDMSAQPLALQDEAADDPDVTLQCDADLFRGILSGSQDPNMAFMMGKLKVKGSMGLAMKLNSILED